MASRLLILITFHAVSSNASCVHNEDCSYLGKCDSTTSTCVCNQGWYGPKCDQLNVSSTVVVVWHKINLFVHTIL